MPPATAALILSVLAYVASVNEAVSLARSSRALMQSRAGTRVREVSKEDAMASMTAQRAFDTFMAMNHSRLDKDSIALIQMRLGDTQRQQRTAATGAAVDKARDMLNDMIDEAVMNRELESVRCREFELKQMRMIASLENDIMYANSEASSAKQEVSRTTGVIDFLQQVQLPKNRQEQKEHSERCKVDVAALQSELKIVMGDKEVMKTILNMVCQDHSLLQTNTSERGGSIVKCVSCASGQQMLWLKHNKIEPLLASLKSKVAKGYVQENLLKEFDQEQRRRPARVRTVLLQTDEIVRQMRSLSGSTGVCSEAMVGGNTSNYRGCQATTITGKPCQKWTAQVPHTHDRTPDKYPNAGLGDHNYCRNPDGSDSIWCYTTTETIKEECEPMFELKMPDVVTKSTCVETNKCTVTDGDCGKMKDRFLVIMAGIQDKKVELSDQLDKLDDSCAELRNTYEETIASQESQMMEEQTNFATATKCLQENQGMSAQANEQHGSLGRDYTSTMDTCCENQNGFTSTICALSRIRGELYHIDGIYDVHIVDCEVSEWVDEECSRSCDGGKQDRTRSVLVHPLNGSECPPLRMERSCNIEGCPVDCKVGDWIEWSECTSACGGGVKSRNRAKTQEPENGGDPCEEQSNQVVCNEQACTADCELADWDEWSLCSKACDTGHSIRRKAVATEERGQGVCADPDDETRLDFKECNTFDCRELLPSWRTTLQCSGYLDLVILLDGSGSLGWYGWQQSTKMAKKLVSHMLGGEHNVKVALLLFSGPADWSALDACTGEDTYAGVPAPETCGIVWISHMTTDIKSVVNGIKTMKWPGRTTLTSYALSEAKAELIQGRPDAQSVVVVITDGKPMSPIKTESASSAIKEQARLIYIPVGQGVKSSIAQMATWASKPPQDNLVTIDDFSTLASATVLNRMISGFCNVVQ